MMNNHIEIIILALFSIAALIQMIYYLLIFMRFVFYKPIEKPNASDPVSIIICARNEAQNLEKYLPLVLEQEYSEFEVVVVNDCSEDETEDVLKRLMNIYPRLRTTYIRQDEKFTHGKKLALTVGIKSAKNEWVLLTDADCYPESKEWLATMAKNFSSDKSIVLGYGGYKSKKNLLNMLIRFDTAIIALQYFSFALIGRPYMGVGRNLAYRKTLFFANKGFASHINLASGDDDLFINEVSNNKNVTIEPSFKAHTRSEAKKSFSDWVDQKQRHFSTFSCYKNKDKFLLALEITSRMAFYIFFAWSLYLHKYWPAATLVLFARLLFQLTVFKYTFHRLKERNLFLISPIFDLVLPIINMGIYLSNIISPRRQWR